jgi:hypothetical protein
VEGKSALSQANEKICKADLASPQYISIHTYTTEAVENEGETGEGRRRKGGLSKAIWFEVLKE